MRRMNGPAEAVAVDALAVLASSASRVRFRVVMGDTDASACRAIACTILCVLTRDGVVTGRASYLSVSTTSTPAHTGASAVYATL